MNNFLEEIIQSGSVTSPDGELKQLHSHIDFDQGNFLQKLIFDIKGEVSLEVGLAYGISALFICDALVKTTNTHHIVIDPYQFIDWDGIGFNNLKMAGYDKLIEFHELPSHIALPKLETHNIQIDFAFIDGWHTFDYALIDFFHIDKMLRVGGIVALDDTSMKGIKKLCKYIMTNRAYSLVGYYGTLTDSQPKSKLHRLIKLFLNPFLTPKRIEFFIKLGIFRGIRCLAFKKEAEDTRGWSYHRYF